MRPDTNRGSLVQMDRNASNPMFGERGAAPIPEEYQKKPPRPPPAPPASPPPEDDRAAHEDFERRLQEAAKKKELGKHTSFRAWFPRMGSSHNNTTEQHDGTEPAGGSPTHAHEPPRRGLFGFGSRTKVAPPKAPLEPPPPDVTEADYAEFDRLKQKAHEQRRKKIRPPSQQHFEEVDDSAHAEFDRQKELLMMRRMGAGRSSLTPLTRIAGQAQSLLAFNPPELKATKGFDDGEKVTDAKKVVEPRFKTRRDRCVYEIRHRHAIERALMAGFAVCLLWLTCLAVARKIVTTAVYGPQLSLVVNLADVALNATDDERVSYAQCASRLEAQCNSSFNSDLIKEINRVNNSLAMNQAVLDSITDQRNNCSDRLGDIVVIADYMANNLSLLLEPRFTNVFNLSANANCSSVKQTLQDQIAAIRAQETAEQFQSVADAQVAGAQNQYQARLDYDNNYLVSSSSALGVNSAGLSNDIPDPQTFYANMTFYRNQSIACTGSTGTYGGVTCPGTPIMVQVNQGRDQIVNQYNNAKDSVNTFVTNQQQTYAPLFNFYNKFSSALSSLAGLKAALDGTANQNGGNGGGLAAFGFVDVQTDFGTPNLPSSATFSNYMGSTAGAAAAADQGSQGLTGSDAQTQDQLNGNTANAKNGQTSWVNSYFSDYNPPPYDLGAQQTQWAQTSSQYLPDVQSNLQTVSRRVNPVLTDQYEPTADTSDSGRTARNIIQDNQIEPLNLYGYPNITVDDLLGNWTEITNLALGMDYAYRVLRSIAIIRSYVSVSAVLAPPADLRVGNSHVKGVAQTVRKNPDQALAALITNPAMNFVLLLIFLGVMSGAFLGVYLPFFNGYHEGCIVENSNYVVNGTLIYTDSNGYLQDGSMLSNLTAKLSIQVAYNDGDTISASAIDRVNLLRELQCSKNEDATFKQMKSFIDEYNFNLQKMASVVSTVDSFKFCLNTTAIDGNLTSTGVSLATGGTTTSAHASLYTASCTTPFPQLNYTAFICANIQPCQLTCQGVRQDTLKKATYDASCTAEHYIHVAILGTFFTFLAYVFMNLGRITLLRGLRRVFLDHFAIGEYSYLATTNEHGETEYPEQVTTKGDPFKLVVRDELHKAIQAYKRSGIYICLVAIIIQVPWAVGLQEFAENLQFNIAASNNGGLRANC